MHTVTHTQVHSLIQTLILPRRRMELLFSENNYTLLMDRRGRRIPDGSEQRCSIPQNAKQNLREANEAVKSGSQQSYYQHMGCSNAERPFAKNGNEREAKNKQV